jgi:uncharacterized protein (TIGR03083 family)
LSGEINKLLGKIERAYGEVDAFLAPLTDAQKTELTDAEGWSVKDHLMHMAVWEDGIDALLSHESRDARMGFSAAAPKPRGLDNINDAIFQQHRDKSLQQVLNAREAIHARFLQTLRALPDDALQRPIRDFDSESASNQPIEGLIVGNTSAHYRKHLGWMQAIVAGE